jgi:hypothetical protein
MPVARKASTKYGVDWSLTPNNDEGTSWPPGAITNILLQEIRDELKQLNALLACPIFVSIPRTLKAIEKNTTKRKPKGATT